MARILPFGRCDSPGYRGADELPPARSPSSWPGGCAATPAQPLVTAYDEATGERTELSVTTYANWVSKTANLLTDELGSTPGDTVLLDLPPHWLVPVFLGAAWSAGLAVTEIRAVEHRRRVCGPDCSASTAAPTQVLACSLLPFAVRFADPFPGRGARLRAAVAGAERRVPRPRTPPTPDTVAWLSSGAAADPGGPARGGRRGPRARASACSPTCTRRPGRGARPSSAPLVQPGVAGAACATPTKHVARASRGRAGHGRASCGRSAAEPVGAVSGRRSARVAPKPLSPAREQPQGPAAVPARPGPPCRRRRRRPDRPPSRRPRGPPRSCRARHEGPVGADERRPGASGSHEPVPIWLNVRRRSARVRRRQEAGLAVAREDRHRAVGRLARRGPGSCRP